MKKLTAEDIKGFAEMSFLSFKVCLSPCFNLGNVEARYKNV